MSKKPIDLLRLFSYNENRIKKLYLLYARSFPERRREWEKLAAEEKVHAEILRGLCERFNVDSSFTRVSPYGQEILNYTKHFLDSQIKLAQKKLISSRQAVVVAIRLELSMLEKKSFDVFSPAGEEVQIVFGRLNRDTKEHAERLQKML